MAMDFSKSPARSRCSLPNSSRQVMVKARSSGVHCIAALQSRTMILRFTSWSRAVGEIVTGTAGARTSRLGSGGWILKTVEVYRPGQEHRAGDMKRAEFQTPAACFAARGGSALKSMSSTACSSARKATMATVNPSTTAPRLRQPQRRARRQPGARRVVATWSGPSRTTTVEPDRPAASRAAAPLSHREDRPHAGPYALRASRIGLRRTGHSMRPKVAAAAPAPYPSAARSPGRG